ASNSNTWQAYLKVLKNLRKIAVDVRWKIDNDALDNVMDLRIIAKRGTLDMPWNVRKLRVENRTRHERIPKGDGYEAVQFPFKAVYYKYEKGLDAAMPTGQQAAAVLANTFQRFYSKISGGKGQAVSAEISGGRFLDERDAEGWQSFVSSQGQVLIK